MAWTALALVLAGLGYAFGVRSYLAWRATGDTGLRIRTGPAGTAAWWAKMLFLASIAMVIAGPVIAFTGPDALLWPASALGQLTGLAMAGAGILLVVAAQHGMGNSWRVGVDAQEVTGLVTGGLFSLARNPIFTGMTIFAIGLALMTPGPFSAAAVLAVIVASQVQVRAVEEPYLAAIHGPAYRQYAAHTGRFLPRIGRLRDNNHLHSNEYDHDHHGHSHTISADADRRWLGIALAAIATFMAAEVAAGVIAQSLALISDAAHMLTDAAAIALALIAMRLAARPATGRYTFGLKRAEILSAQVNGLALLLLAAWLAYEAVSRLWQPPQVTGWIVIVTGITGLAVNLVAAWAISKANRASLNIQGAYQHVLMDALASAAAIAAGAAIALFGFQQADPIATLIVVALMIKSGWRLLKDATRVLLEAAPTGLDTDTVAAALLTVDHVVEIHDLHVWQITSGQPALSAHVLVEPDTDCHRVRVNLQQVLASVYRINHATLQVDHSNEHDSAAVTAEHCAEAHGARHRRDSGSLLDLFHHQA